MDKKSGVFLIAFGILISLTASISALGISPAFKEYNFQPGLEGSIDYVVFAPENTELEISVAGDLAQYVTLSKTILKGGGAFTAEFKLPENVEIPGLNRVRIYVGEKIDPELATGFIGTRLVVISQIDIYVPYPGRYLEIGLKGHDANVGEPVNFELAISSKGKEEVIIVPMIEIYSGGGLVDALVFSQRTIASQENVVLTKPLDTSKLNSGTYKAVAKVDYGILVQDELDFRIGSLNIEIRNYTNKFYLGKLQKFEVSLESGWNDKIDGAYTEIQILNGSEVLDSFRTTTIELTPWEQKSVEGYFDTSNYSEGFYDANITAVYYGKEQGKSTSKLVKIQFIKATSLLLWYLIGGIGVLIILGLGLVKMLRKNGAQKTHRKK
jgi:hypothetical protein